MHEVVWRFPIKVDLVPYSRRHGGLAWLAEGEGEGEGEGVGVVGLTTAAVAGWWVASAP